MLDRLGEPILRIRSPEGVLTTNAAFGGPEGRTLFITGASRGIGRAIAERLATLGTQFAQNLLADEQAYQLVLDGEADLAGLPPFVRDAAAAAARRCRYEWVYACALSSPGATKAETDA